MTLIWVFIVSLKIASLKLEHPIVSTKKLPDDKAKFAILAQILNSNTKSLSRVCLWCDLCGTEQIS